MADYYVDFDGNITKKKKKKKQNTVSSYTVDFDGNITKVKSEPVKKTVTTSKDKKDERTWFQKSKGNFIETVLGSAGDVFENMGEGIIGMGEKALDSLMMLGASMNEQKMMETANNEIVFNAVTGKETDKVLDKYQKMQKDVEESAVEFVQKDLYDEKAVTDKFIRDPIAKTGIDTQNNSIFGAKSDSLAQSGGQLVATAVLNPVIPWYVTTGATSMGGEVENALKQGSTFDEAVLSGVITAGADILTEKLSGGIKFGGKTLDDVMIKPLTEKIASKTVKTLVNLGLDASGEGFEEVLAGAISNLGTALYKEENVGELLFSEEAVDEYIESFIGGAVLGGVSSGAKTVKETINAKKQPKLTANEQKVVDSVVENRITEAEADGKKLTNSEKTKIRQEVQAELQKGYIDIDTIESTLGGETFNQYKTMTDEESLLEDKIKSLENTKSISERKQLIEAKERLEALQKDADRTQRKTQLEEQLHTEVDKLTENDTFLRESYNERTRRGQNFEADVEQYTGKGKEVVQKAIDSGKLNNTRRTRDFVDFLAKTSTGNSIDYDFTNTGELQKLGLAVEGKTADGYVDGETIGLNIQSNKALNKAVGHDIVRLLEGNEGFQAIQDEIKAYADKKGDYKALYDSLNTQYQDMKSDTDATEHEAKIRKEVTANLLGNYIFTDSNFVNEFAVKNPKTFKKVYEEIKKLLKNTNQGSKEEKALQDVKKLFDNASKQDVKDEAESYRNSFVNKTTDRKRIINKLTGKEIDTKTYDVLDRLSKGEAVSVEEVESLKEVQEGIRKTDELLDDFIAKNNISPDIDRAKVGTYLLNTLERAELKDSIIKKRLKEGSFTGIDKKGNEVYNGDVKKGKRLDIVIGLPASGKSSSIVNPLSQYYKSAVIDSDIIKKELPEFNEGWGGTLVHEESSLINTYLLDDIMDTGSNVVLPIVGSKVSSVDKYIDLAKSKGYEINVHLNELPNSKAIGRMLGRYFSEGRFINPSYAMAYGDKPTAVFEEIKQRSDINGYSRWNNDVAKGQRPKLAEISENNRPYGVYNGTYGQVSGDAIGQTDSKTTSEESRGTNQIAPTKTPENGVFFDAPMTEQQANERDAMQSDRIGTLDEADMPAEVDAPIYEPTEVKNPFDERDIKGVGNRQVKAYMYENPEVKPYFQEEAQIMLGELQRSVKGEKHFNDRLYYDTNGENGWFGTKRETSEEIAYLLDNFKYTYADIEKGLKAIIEDNGKENNAISKRIEFMIDERLREGHTDFETGMEIPANEDYINLLTNKQITEYSDEAYNQWVKSLSDTFVNEDPLEDIAPTRQYEAIEPKPKENPDYTEQEQEWANNKMARADRPRKNDGKTQRRWVETSTESEVVNREILPDDLDQSAIYYEPISNKTTLTKANNNLDRMGYDKALEYFNSQLENKSVRLEDVALGERLLQEAMKKGDTKTAGELIQNIAILGTELGQKVQALSIIQRMTPEGQLKMLQKTVNRGKAKGDKAYNGVEITQEMIDYILKTYNKDGTFDQNKLNDAVETVKKKIADQMKVTAMDKVNAWRYLSMLGNPKTHIRNLVSNVFMTGTMRVKDALARTIETVAPIKDRTKTWKSASEEVKKYAEQTTAEMKDVLSSENGYSEDATIKSKRDTFKNKILNGVYEFNNNLLTKEDWWFKKSAFRRSFQEYLTANGIETQEDIKNNPELVEKAKNYAVEQAQIATFQQYSWLANKISEIERKNVATQIGVGAVLPFKKTPINIAKTGLAYSPLGFAKTLTYDIAQVKKGNMEASTLVDHLAQNTVGSVLVFAGYMLAMSGFLNGGGEDDKESKYDYQLGEQSYSLSIDGKTYSLSWLSPIAMPLFIGANAYEMFEQDKELTFDTTADALAKTLDPMSEMSFLSSLDSALSSYDSGMGKFKGIAEAMLQNYVTQFVPTLSSQFATVLDDKKRDTKVSADSGAKIPEQTLNKLLYKIPFLRETLEPSTDIWGNEVKQTENILTRAFETFIAPYSRKDSIATEIDKEIKDLYSKTGEDGLIPTIPKNTVKYDGVTYKMSSKEYTAYKKTYGQTANDLLEDLFKTTSYKNADAGEKVEMVEKVYDYAKDKAKIEYLDKEGVIYTNSTEDKLPVYKENKIKGAIENDMTLDEFDLFSKSKGKYYISKAIGGYEVYDSYNSVINDIEGDKDRNGNTINGSKKTYVENYINGLPLDYGRKILLFTSKYPKDDTYKADVLEYLKGRSDITYDEMVEILTELNYEVYHDGTVRW